MAAEPEVKRTPYVIEWRDGFKVNIPQPDAEHRHLFELVGALSLKTIDKTIEELLDYVVTHFTNEQELMEKSGYPAFEAHLKLHEDFSAHVADVLGSGDEWSEERVQELRRFLNKWLIGHIMTHDMRFGKWYTDHHGPNAPFVEAPAQKRGLLARIFGMH